MKNKNKMKRHNRTLKVNQQIAANHNYNNLNRQLLMMMIMINHLTLNYVGIITQVIYNLSFIHRQLSVYKAASPSIKHHLQLHWRCWL